MQIENKTRLDIETVHRLLVESVTDYAIFMLDPSGTVISWNTGAQRFKGYSAEEIIGSNFGRFYTEEDRARGEPRRALHTAEKEGKFETEAWRVRKDGTRFWAHVVIDPIFDVNGELVGFAKITRDVTERMKAREELLESEQRFRILVQGVTDYAIFMLDPNGQVSNWNPGAARIKQYTAAEIVGKHFSTFYTEEDRADGRPARALETASREGKFEAEGWRVRKDGTRFWAHVVIDAIRNESGELIGFAKITRDLTERRQVNEQLELAQKALFHAQKMDAIGQLTGGVAHDFNNLLTVIISSLELVRRKVHEPRDVRILDNALQAAHRGSQLTGQLLAFARKQVLQPEHHNPNQLIESFEAILRRAAGDTIELSVDLATDIRQILVDPAQFEAAILNLVVNSRDASGDQGRKIQVTTENVVFEAPRNLLLSTIPSGPYVAVSVSDNGSGIPHEVLAKVCEPFFTTKDVGKGTGLGLSQVYGFTAQSGGHLHIDTDKSRGTTVTMYMPAGEPVEAEETRPPGKGAGTVLIVDDDEQVMSVAVDMFDSLGYDVLTANDAMEALHILRRDRQIDLLFSDIVMPRGMNGTELAREARTLRPGIKIILASGYPVAALEQSGASISETAFIAKPYRWAEIVDRVRGLETKSKTEAV